MRRMIVLLCLTVVLLVGAAHLYRNPRVRELFRSAPDVGQGLKPMVAPAAVTTPDQSASRRPGEAVRPAAVLRQRVRDPKPEDGPHDLTSNEKTSRVLLQVLAAKGLVSGVSLEVSDHAIRVMGAVESVKKRSAILAIIEKAREARDVDATGLVALK
ncbi:MAG: hypothetical protein HXY20_07200 [Acidobacteria bacterium]|nr:hypothetical protein [Acidobacteriota bacterium]